MIQTSMPLVELLKLHKIKAMILEPNIVKFALPQPNNKGNNVHSEAPALSGCLVFHDVSVI